MMERILTLCFACASLSLIVATFAVIFPLEHASSAHIGHHRQSPSVSSHSKNDTARHERFVAIDDGDYDHDDDEDDDYEEIDHHQQQGNATKARKLNNVTSISDVFSNSTSQKEAQLIANPTGQPTSANLSHSGDNTTQTTNVGTTFDVSNPQTSNLSSHHYEGKDLSDKRSDFDRDRLFMDSIIDLKDKANGTYAPWNLWKADCNSYASTYNYGWITSISNDNGFHGLDHIKCAGQKLHDFEKSRSGYMLDLHRGQVLQLHNATSADGFHCDRGYLLTAVWADDQQFQHLKYAKCVRLTKGLIDYSSCDIFNTTLTEKTPTYKATSTSKVQCPQEWAAVGLKMSTEDGNSRIRIKEMRCCKLVPPHPPSDNHGGFFG